LFVGRLVEKKGLRYLLDAMPAIIARDSRAELLVVGFGPELPALREQAARLGIEGQVRFVGAVSQEDLPQFYRNATVFVAPFVEASNGDREGLGLVVAEAMACGCPVVVGNVGGASDLLGGGDNGLLVDARKPSALAAAIVELLVDEERRLLMASRGAAFVRTNFGWDAIAARYAALLKRVIQSPSSPGG
jgi:glycosyltransferase involved in cell wall biosynthesis